LRLHHAGRALGGPRRAEDRLRREITALRITNRLVDAGGAALVPALVTELGVAIPDVAAALLLAEDVLEIEPRRAALLALPAQVSRAVVHGALLEIDRGVRAVARFLVKSGGASLDAELVERRRAGFAALRADLGGFLSDVETTQMRERAAALVAQGLPEALADEIALVPLADRGLNVLRLAERVAAAPADVARVYVRLGEAAGIHTVQRRLRDAEATGVWDRMALVDLRWDLLDLQRQIAEQVLSKKPEDPLAAAHEFLDRHETLLESVVALEKQLVPTDGASALFVIASRLRGLLGEAGSRV